MSEMTQARTTSSFRTALAAAAAVVISAMSLAVPIVAPFVAAASGILLFASYRHRSSAVLYVALALILIVFVTSLVIDFGLLTARIQSGTPTRVSP